MKELISRLERQETASEHDLAALLEHHRDPELAACLARAAGAVRDRHFGRTVYLRGLIEFTNYCKNDCLYCGLRKSNLKVDRYRLSLEDILAVCAQGAALGFRTFVLQGGEDPAQTGDRLVEMVRAIRREFPGQAITLSVGEQPRETYARLRQAGADRFLLRHETADPDHYAQLHPPALTLAHRRRCLEDLQSLGFQVGAGFMVGSPFQTYERLARDLVFLREFKPQMVGIGPFIPHPETPLAGYPAGSAELTVFLLGLTRLLLPKALLPATTALGTVDPQGREKALTFGANVMMPNLSPLEVRAKYDIYTGKIFLDEEAAESVARLRARLAELGYETPSDRGDYPG